MRSLRTSFVKTITTVLFISIIICIASGAVAEDKKNKPIEPSVLRARFMRAAQGYGDFKELQELIVQGVDVNSRDSYNRTVLIKAVKRGKLVAVKILISAGANVNHKDDMGFTALMYATVMGNEMIIKELKNANAFMSKDDERIVSERIKEEEEKKKRQQERLKAAKRLREAQKTANELKEKIKKQEEAIKKEQEERANKIKEESK